MSKRILAVLAYVLPTFPLGYGWHLAVFAKQYQALQIYREDLLFPLGLASMLIQGWIWAVLYERLFSGQPVLQGAFRFGRLAAPLAWSFMALAVAAKHPMNSVSGFLMLESGFIALHYLIVSPLIAAVYRDPVHG